MPRTFLQRAGHFFLKKLSSVWPLIFIKKLKIVTIFRGTWGTTWAPGARCRVLKRGSWGPFVDPARSAGRGTRRLRVRAWPLSQKNVVKSSFWAIPAGRLSRIRGPSRPAQGQGRLVAGVKHTSATSQIFLGAQIAEFQRKRFWTFWTMCTRSVADGGLVCWRPRRCTGVLPAPRCADGL